MLRIALLVGLVFYVMSKVALADTYELSWTWVDPTNYTSPDDAPTYEIEWRCTGAHVSCTGAWFAVTALPNPAHNLTTDADPGDLFEARVRNENGGLVSAWSAILSENAPAGPTQPLAPTSIIFSITRQ